MPLSTPPTFVGCGSAWKDKLDPSGAALTAGEALGGATAHAAISARALDRREDAYDATSNPDGYVALCLAESKLV